MPAAYSAPVTFITPPFIVMFPEVLLYPPMPAQDEGGAVIFHVPLPALCPQTVRERPPLTDIPLALVSVAPSQRMRFTPPFDVPLLLMRLLFVTLSATAYQPLSRSVSSPTIRVAVTVCSSPFKSI